MKARSWMLALLLTGCAAPVATSTPSAEQSRYPIPSAALQQMKQAGQQARVFCSPLLPVLTASGLECWTDQQFRDAGWSDQMIEEEHQP